MAAVRNGTHWRSKRWWVSRPIAPKGGPPPAQRDGWYRKQEFGSAEVLAKDLDRAAEPLSDPPIQRPQGNASSANELLCLAAHGFP